ncbi:uncharacterized protein LOC114762069 [Neltuma alba]|uniref:uncharacterized protein LOC114762069 n=1 Tax=Neltuma alba TaxID=207710 RepID=UPI0010A5273E|nr:uncharacterized protein LOC114762069 [Prosopis alba]
MAPPETRSSTDRMGDIERRLDQQQSILESVTTRMEQQSSDIGDLKVTLQDISTKLSNLHSPFANRPASADAVSQTHVSPRLPAFGSFHELHNSGSSSSYSIATKQSRVEFPKFDGSDFRGWAYRARQFFEVDGTPADQRIRLLSIHLEGHALQWHQTFMRHRSSADISWAEHFRQMEVKFADVRDEHPLITLKKLQQLSTSVSEYEQQFDELLSEVDIPEPVAINLFIGGLRPDIQKFVLNFAPSTLTSAMSTARLQESTIHALHENAPVSYHRSVPPTGSSAFGVQPGSALGPKISPSVDATGFSKPKPIYQSSIQPSVSAAASTFPNTKSAISSKPTRQLSKREMDDRRRKGLCYWCPEKFAPGHRCKESHLFTLVIDEDDEHFEDAIGVAQIDAEGAINAIEGDDKAPTLKLMGQIKNQKVIILVDTGSTHNVLHTSVAKRLQLKPVERNAIRLTVADSRQVTVSKCCPNLSWDMGNSTFVADFLVMKIGGYDMILGTQWLRTIGRFTMDIDLRLFEFTSGGKKIELRGLGYAPSPVIKELSSNHDILTAACIFLLNTSSSLHVGLGNTSPLPEMCQQELLRLLDTYADIFEEPKELPPSRPYDHAIPLHNDKPISCRPYRYGPAQKTEIEKQVQEMLQNGIIRESSSSFAAPVVLV